ncbi:hypothetical protein ACJX0J_029703, partial [Zea mays]
FFLIPNRQKAMNQYRLDLFSVWMFIIISPLVPLLLGYFPKTKININTKILAFQNTFTNIFKIGYPLIKLALLWNFTEHFIFEAKTKI